MKNIQILDCTLRDGGYVNNNTFGKKNIKKIITYLENCGIDIIECGYIMDDINNNEDKTEYSSFDNFIKECSVEPHENLTYALMLLGEKYNINNLPKCTNKKINTIRMTFHKKNIKKAIEYAKEIIKKGYRLYMQPTVIMNYSDDEIIAMIKTFNDELDIEAIAIVDTFGEMTTKDIIHVTKLFDDNLKPSTKLAFHSHNNLQMAFSNAVTFIENIREDRPIVIDSSIYGMGRGAGNLPTELIASYLNTNYNKKYNITSLLEATDNIIEKIKEKENWGYSLPYYLSAIYSCHPSYIIYLLNKKMINNNDIHNIIKMISKDKKVEFDKEYISELYQVYNSNEMDDKESYQKLYKLVKNKQILLIGPGKTIIEQKDKINNYIKENNTFVITINNPELYKADAVFYSNNRRYNEFQNNTKKTNIKILTSNIKCINEDSTIIFDYNKSLSRKDGISDSSLLIMLSILEQLNINKVVLAGFDGFSIKDENFYDSNVEYILDKNYVKDLNKQIRNSINCFKEKMDIVTLTPSINID